MNWKRLIEPRISVLSCATVLAWVTYFTWANTRTVDFGGFSGYRGFPFRYWTYTDVGPPFDSYHPEALMYNAIVLLTVIAIVAVSSKLLGKIGHAA